MISRKSTLNLAEAYEREFTKTSVYVSGRPTIQVNKDRLYDFLYEHEYSAWFCNAVKGLHNIERQIKELIMKLHTGETQYQTTTDWSWEQRQQLGQSYLFELSKDMLNYLNDMTKGWYADRYQDRLEKLQNTLELDGLIYKNGELYFTEAELLDTEKEKGILNELYQSLGLDNEEIAMHHLKLSEDHFISGKWDDAISNSRKFLECILSEVAKSFNIKLKSKSISSSIYESPAKVRDYLETEGLLESKEKKAIASVYNLLSTTGGHPYMARNDQARLLRNLALTLSQFVLLRFESYLKKD
jgi:hypothetical protein